MTDLLQIGRSGVLAYQGALQTIGENVTNANTDGYSRREVILREQDSYSGPYALTRSAAAFGGVRATEVGRVWDQYKAQNAWSANSDANGSSTRAQYLTTMQTALNDTNSGIGTRLTAIYTTASQLAANPTDTNLRQTFIASIGDAATAIKTTAASLTRLATTTQTQATVTVQSVNDNLGTLAKVNLALRTEPQGTAARAQLEDQRDGLLNTISGAMSVDTSFETDGSVTVRMNDNQGAMLLAAKAQIPSTISLSADPTNGRLALTVRDDTGATTPTPTGGTLAGLIGVSQTNAGRQDQLNQIAVQLVSTLTTFQRQGLNANGVAGTSLLTGTKASDLAPASTDPNEVAAADATGDNGNLQWLASVRNTDGMEEKWKAIVTDQSLQVSSATLASSAASTRKDGAYSALDQTTGVDLDNEAADLLRYQQAYAASAKVISAARETLQNILDLF